MTAADDDRRPQDARDDARDGGSEAVRGDDGAGSRPDFLEATIADDGGGGDAGRPLLARLPWGGALALLLVLVVERLVLGPFGPWEWIGEHVPDHDLLARSAVADRLELGRALDYEPSRPRLVVAGTSRAEAAFRPELIPDAWMPELDCYLRAHVRVFPQELATMVDEVLRHEPDLLVWILSEQELASPLRLVPAASGGDLTGVAHIARVLGRRVWDDAPEVQARTSWMRMIAVGLSDSYRYRPVLGAAFSDGWRRFPMSLDAPPPADPSWPTVLASGPPFPLTAEREAELAAELVALFPDKRPAVRAQINQIRSVRDGAHATAKRALAEGIIGRLRAADVQVLLVEIANHPQTEALHDRAADRARFLAWARGLAAGDAGVTLLELETWGRPEAQEYRDLTHLNKLGARRATTAVLATAQELLGE